MKISENKHIKNVHHVTKRTHQLFKNSKICNYTNALLLILILSVAILAAQMFLNKQNTNVPEAEIRFSELSKDSKIAGTIMPASCESNPFLVANGDGNFTGCATVPCWDGTAIIPAAGQTCPARPTQTCWDGLVITPSLGETCPSQYCGDDTGIYSGTPEGVTVLENNRFNRCTCDETGKVKRIRTNSTTIDPNDPSKCTPITTTLASNNSYKLKKGLMSLLPETAHAGIWGGPICVNSKYAVCMPPAPAVNIYFSDPNAIYNDSSGGAGDGGAGGDGGGY